MSLRIFSETIPDFLNLRAVIEAWELLKDFNAIENLRAYLKNFVFREYVTFKKLN